MALFFAGLGAGVLNGLLGAGGGIIAVAFLSKLGLKAKQSHATSIAIILPLTFISLIVYGLNGNLPFLKTLPFVLPALAGSAVGAVLLKKVNPGWLKLAFSLLVFYSAWKTLTR